MLSFHTTMTHCWWCCLNFTSCHDGLLYESFCVFLAWFEWKYVKHDCFLLSCRLEAWLFKPLTGSKPQQQMKMALQSLLSDECWLEWAVMRQPCANELVLVGEIVWICFAKRLISDLCWHSFSYWPFLQDPASRVFDFAQRVAAKSQRVSRSWFLYSRGRSILIYYIYII